MTTVKQAVAAAAAIVAIVAVGAAVVVGSGFYDVSATRQHTRFVYDVLRWALRRSIDRRSRGIEVPHFDAAMAGRGLIEYQENCSRCHGAPGIAPAAFALGMAPLPTNLVYAARTSSSQAIFWTIKHGIKMTGMPAWEYRLDDGRIWSITAFVTTLLPSLSPQQYRERLDAASSEGTETEAPPGALTSGLLDSEHARQTVAPFSAAAATAAQVARDRSARPAFGRGAVQSAPARSASALSARGGFAALPPVLGDPARGARAIPQYACTTCHTIPGIVGRPVRVGPPLRGVALRSYVGGELPNTPRNMVRWLLDPHAVEPQSAMPGLGLSPRDAADVAAYLYTLDRP